MEVEEKTKSINECANNPKMATINIFDGKSNCLNLITQEKRKNIKIEIKILDPTMPNSARNCKGSL